MGQHVLESVSRVRLLTEITRLELVKVTWQFCLSRGIQFPFHLTPEAFYGVVECSSTGVNKVFGVVDHQVNVTYIVQVKVWQELV